MSRMHLYDDASLPETERPTPTDLARWRITESQVLWLAQQDCLEQLGEIVVCERVVSQVICRKCGVLLADIAEVLDADDQRVATVLSVYRQQEHKPLPEDKTDFQATAAAILARAPMSRVVNGQLPKGARDYCGVIESDLVCPEPPRRAKLQCARHGPRSLDLIDWCYRRPEKVRL